MPWKCNAVGNEPLRRAVVRLLCILIHDRHLKNTLGRAALRPFRRIAQSPPLHVICSALAKC
jgi:hypothetical protein